MLRSFKNLSILSIVCVVTDYSCLKVPLLYVYQLGQCYWSLIWFCIGCAVLILIHTLAAMLSVVKRPASLISIALLLRALFALLPGHFRCSIVWISSSQKSQSKNEKSIHLTQLTNQFHDDVQCPVSSTGTGTGT